MDIYEHIKKLVSSKGLTLADFAEKLGITRQTLNSNMKSPSYPTLVKMAEALDVPIWRLLVDPSEVGEAADADSLVVFMRYRNQEMILHTADEVLDMLHDWDVPKFLDSCRRHTIQALRDSYPADLRVQSLLDELSAAVRSL